ncbi:MAG TPA: VOC family protein [Allosphingosinicella sp.]|jgi:catechol 2,3-dioxygenase-like lactoylglutathione lyase family enzyme
MAQHIARIALLVRDYDEAIAWYTQKLGFILVQDDYLPEEDKRWVAIAPPGAPPSAATLLLARATKPEQQAALGSQGGGRVLFFLHTDDFDRDYRAFEAAGIRFVRGPAEMPYGKVGVFEDLYGNLWDLVQPAA